MAVGVVASLVSPTTADQTPVLPLVCMTTFFVLLLVRLSLAAARDRFRRIALLTLTAGVGLWAGGSSVLNAGGNASVTHFPAPGEWLFLASYVAMAAFLYLDARHRVDRALMNWLDAAVVCGGTACLAGGLLLTPVALQFGAEGVPLLVALLYPLVDVVLGLLVLGQVVLRLRPPSPRAWALVAAFAAFAVADSTFVLNLSSGTYQLGAVLYLLWGIGFALLCGAAVRTEVDTAAPTPRRQGPVVLVGASVVAMLVLVARPAGHLGWYLAVPAVATLTAAGWRMVLALREARGAAEAYRLARTDDLTELPNRRAVLLRLDEGISSGGPLALMLLDLDGFKEINDTLGHAAGDAMLELAATRMCRALGDDVLVARLGGDEFALVLPMDDPLELVETAERVRQLLKAPARVDGLEVAMDVSVGIAVLDGHDSTSTDLLRRADVAMYQAKLGRVGRAAVRPEPGRVLPAAAAPVRGPAPRHRRRSAGGLVPAADRRATPSRCAGWRRWCAGRTPGRACSHRPPSCPAPGGPG